MTVPEVLGGQISAAWLALAAGCGPLVQWLWGAVRDRRAERRLDSAGVVEQMGTLLDRLRRELDRTTQLRDRYSTELDKLRAARWTMEDVMAELRDQAIAARSMVHERERSLGMAETVFVPLPQIAARSPGEAP